MPPLTYIHASEAARTTAGGRGVGGGKIPPPTACKWLRTDGAAREKPSVLGLFRVAPAEDRRSIAENGARGAGGRKARFCPAEGRDAPSACLCFTHRTNN